MLGRSACSDQAGRCYAWDVVNEVVDDDGTLRSSPWFDTIGEDYIRIAFETAAEVAAAANDPVKLYYNDFGIEFPGVKSDAAQKRESCYTVPRVTTAASPYLDRPAR